MKEKRSTYYHLYTLGKSIVDLRVSTLLMNDEQ